MTADELRSIARKELLDAIEDSFYKSAFAGRVSAKKMRDLVSDVNEKFLKGVANKKEPLSAEEVFWLSRIAGKSEDGYSPFEEGDDGGVTAGQLEGYANHLRNYLYTYKDEAQEIDPSIDPHEEHEGPMAQDIEKVAPDCVKETPEGVKTVDGNRLALVNAGVIGELARRVLELEEKLNGSS